MTAATVHKRQAREQRLREHHHSVDGYVTGPGKGVGEGGERLHYWVFGGPWSYDAEPETEPGAGLGGFEKEWMDAVFGRMGPAVAGRNMYEAAGHWGDTNPWGVPCFIVTHRPQEQPAGDDFVFVDGLAEEIERAKAATGDRDVSLGGGADVIRQALEQEFVDDLSIVIAPVVLGARKRLFEGFTKDVELEHLGVHQSIRDVHRLRGEALITTAPISNPAARARACRSVQHADSEGALSR